GEGNNPPTATMPSLIQARSGEEEPGKGPSRVSPPPAPAAPIQVPQRPQQQQQQQQQQQDEVPRSECKTVVLAALEHIVRDVLEQREREGRGDGGGDGARGSDRERESVLREAIRAWLRNVEMAE